MKQNLNFLSGEIVALKVIVMSLLVYSSSCQNEKNYMTIGFGKANLAKAGIYKGPAGNDQDLKDGNKYKYEEKFAVTDRALKDAGALVQEVSDTLIQSGHKLFSAIYERPLEIKKKYCGKRDSEVTKKKADRKSVLQGEIDGINTYYLELFKDNPYLIKPIQDSVRLYLITHGKGIITQGVRQFEVNGLNLFVPSIMEEASVLADTGDFGMLEIVIRLTSAEYQLLKQDQNKLPYFVDYTQCRQYREAIKSEKTISRMILPEDIIPRFCMGSVETSGPDKVGAHSHPMLEQLFYGLKGNDCIVEADGIKTAFKENTLLHIPSGSRHGVDVEEGKLLNYVWMDLFRSQEEMGYIKENHIMKDK